MTRRTEAGHHEECPTFSLFGGEECLCPELWKRDEGREAEVDSEAAYRMYYDNDWDGEPY